ncbi:Riboflavin synthase eubacterial/eukaryotic [hydrothermal vent metagenome]|uniref:Riboflavin synthase n=1 Tax=hydrothermal vent metagenome TaxID=652676 RepID=A0A3B1D202_9ZZZZ
MFTGIIQEMGTVSGIDKKGNIARLGIVSGQVARTADIGDSISVNGVCLTITSLQQGIMLFDLSAETLNTSNTGRLKKGDRVNLEPALRPSDRLGGHFVTGHIDGMGSIKRRNRIGNTIEIEIGATEEVIKYIVKKGSIAIDGISLTVVDIERGSFKVVIIPHTEHITTIGQKEVNYTVNLEVDILGKYVAKFLHTPATEEKDDKLLTILGKSGFL